MKIGMDLLLWTDAPSQEHLPLLEKLKGWGFDGVELPLDYMTRESAAAYRRELSSLGLEATGIISLSARDGDPIGSAKERQAAGSYMKRCLDLAAELDIHVIGGPLYQGLGRFTGQGPAPQEIERCVSFFQEVALYAQAREITLAGEPINRFETYFVNTVEQACHIIDQVASPAFGLHVDTCHGNLEELDVCAAWRQAGSRIRHVHISENTRGIPGTGHAVPQALFQVLKEIGYDGWLTIEAFCQEVPALARRLHIWRELAPAEAIASQGCRYIAEMLALCGIPRG